jgi:hypothetical protein
MLKRAWSRDIFLQAALSALFSMCSGMFADARSFNVISVAA